jgi:acetyl-CoA decarbonylase/synthase complex subunit gamma
MLHCHTYHYAKQLHMLRAIKQAEGGQISEAVPGFTKWLDTPAGRVPQISTTLTFSDHLGACKARWAIARMNYIVPSGLYAIGTQMRMRRSLSPPIYKMSYDIIRSALAGRNLWLLVLETFGVNVWCAAGKGTFGTDELVSRISKTELHRVVNHRQLILPILGAPGVAAHEVAKKTGFTIRYATIRANDLPEYLDNGMHTTTAMRELTFTTYERLVLVPVELVTNLKHMVLNRRPDYAGRAGLQQHIHWHYHVGRIPRGSHTGLVVVPVLLPWIPGHSFSLKGALLGLLWCSIYYLLSSGQDWRLTTIIAAFLALPAVSAYHALNFTGCTVYTSRSGVKKEMRLAIPMMGAAVAAGVILVIAGLMF